MPTERNSDSLAFNAMLARFWQVEVLDNDGETQTYLFAACTAWDVLTHMHGVMLRDGDFYGHHEVDTVNVTLAELIGKPEGDNFYTISGIVED